MYNAAPDFRIFRRFSDIVSQVPPNPKLSQYSDQP